MDCRAISRRLRAENGQTIVEFALVAPLFIALIVAIVEIGVTFNRYLAVTDAARVAARNAAVSHDSAAARAAGQASAGGVDVAVAVAPPAGGWTSGATVAATATYNYSIDVLGIVLKSGTLTSRTVERVE
jgi:Flp pilus assembly protein TadG